MAKYLGLSNYYGSVEVEAKEDGTFIIGLEDHSGYDERNISEELYNLLIKELHEQDDEEEESQVVQYGCSACGHTSPTPDEPHMCSIPKGKLSRR